MKTFGNVFWSKRCKQLFVCNFVTEGKVCLNVVLIVDSDLAFVFWLGHLLDASGYSAYPAKSVADAALLLMQLDLAPSLLVINSELVSAPDFISALHRSHPDLRAISVINNPQSQHHYPGTDGALPKPRVLDESAHAEWLDCIRQLLANSAAQRTGT